MDKTLMKTGFGRDAAAVGRPRAAKISRVMVVLTAKQRDSLLRIIGQRMDSLSESMTKARDMGATLHLPIVSDELETLAAARERLKVAS